MQTLMSFLKPNIESKGRLIRGVTGAILLISGFPLWNIQPWVSAVLWISAVFVLFEAFRGWCVLRACGIKTKF